MVLLRPCSVLGITDGQNDHCLRNRQEKAGEVRELFSGMLRSRKWAHGP